MSKEWWIIPTLALGCLAVVLWGIVERTTAHRQQRIRVRPGGFLTALLLLNGVFFGGPIRDGWRDRENRDLCHRRLTQLSFALLLYVQDHDERFPPARTWGKVIESRLPRPDSFRCPADRFGRDYSYALNRAVSQRWYPELPAPQLILLFESDQGRRNAYGEEEDLAPVSRHHPFHLGGLRFIRPDPDQSGHFFAFGDGHVEWLTTREQRDPGAALWKIP